MSAEALNRALEQLHAVPRAPFDLDQIRELPSGSLTDLARNHQFLFAEIFEDQLELDFKALENDLKPAVLAEISYSRVRHPSYGEFVEELADFRIGLFKLGYWDFRNFDNPSFFDMWISKIRSIGLVLSRIRTVPLDFMGGAVGLLLGHSYQDELKFVRQSVPFVELRPPFR